MAGVELGGAVTCAEHPRRGVRRPAPRDDPLLHRRGQHAREPEARAAIAARCAVRARRCRSRSRSRSHHNSSRARNACNRARKLRGDASTRSPRDPRASRCRSSTTRSTARSGWRPRWTRAVTAGRATCPRRVRRTTAALLLGGHARPLPGHVQPPRHLHAPAARRADARTGRRAVGRGTRARRPAHPPHAVPARPVAIPRVGHRDLGVDRGGDRDRGQRPRRERAQPVALPARVADAAVDPGRRHPVRARARRRARRRRRSTPGRPAAPRRRHPTRQPVGAAA